MKRMIFKPVVNFTIINRTPIDGEEVWVKQCVVYKDAYVVKGYERDYDGIACSFCKKHFREPNLTKELAKSFMKQDSKVREQEHEKVFSLTEKF